jgi:hypothetical protein
MHIVPACTGSGEGSDHFRSYVRSLSMHFGRRLLPGLELMTSWSQGNNITVAPGLPFINGTPSVTPQGFVSCNHTLIMDVIKGLNQFGINSLQIQRLDLSLIFHLNSVGLWSKCSIQKLCQIIHSISRKILIIF